MKKWSTAVTIVLGIVAFGALILAAIGLIGFGYESHELSVKTKQYSAAQAAAASTQAALQEQLGSQSARASDLASQLSDAQDQIASLQNAKYCTNKPYYIDYSDNSSVSDSLKSWLDSTEGGITGDDWDYVWDNSRVSIHKIHGNYLYAYVVYFDESSLGFSNAVFDLTNMCWLDR
ncbi:MAG TPA: hypothetical protein VMC09_17990 [Anaerolineales bacterium]|nr:hypothetical protein [Anaerolineales bacterium]